MLPGVFDALVVSQDINNTSGVFINKRPQIVSPDRSSSCCYGQRQKRSDYYYTLNAAEYEREYRARSVHCN